MLHTLGRVLGSVLCEKQAAHSQNTWATTMNENMSIEALQITLAWNFTFMLCYADPLTSPS